MAPPPKARENNYIAEIGVAGRKTGITIKDTGQRDVFGMEPMVGFFSPEVSVTLGIRNPNAGPSSPSKTSENQTNSVEESMDIVTSDPPVGRITNRASLPPRARSPIKTNLNSPARRASSVGYSSPAPPQHLLARGIKINRKLDFSTSEQPSSGPTNLESSPGLPPAMPPAPTGTTSSPPRNVRLNGSSLSSSVVDKEKTQAPAARNGKAKTKPQLEQVVEEGPPTPLAEPTPPAKKKSKRGLLVSKKAAVGEKKKAFSMEDLDSDDESMDETEAPEQEEEEEEEEEGGEELHKTADRDAFDRLPQIIDDSVMEDDIVMGEEEEDNESLPDVIPSKPKPKPKAKSTKAEPESAKSKAAAAKKTKTIPLDKGKGKEVTQPTKTKASGAGKITKGKTVKPTEESEPTPAAKAKPAPRAKGKKVPPPVRSPEETEEEIMEEEPQREPTPPPLKSKIGAKGKGKSKVVVEEEPEPEPTPKLPSKAKAAVGGKGKGRGKVVEVREEISESEQEQEPEPERLDASEKEEEEEEEGEEEQPAKKRPRTTKEKAPPKQKIPAKAKGKAPAAPPKEKPVKTTKKIPQKPAAPSPELEAFTPSSQPARTKAKVNKTTKAETSSSIPPRASRPAEKKSGQRIVKAPPPPPRASTQDIDGIRRSSRARVEPLAFWKNEKMVYGLGAPGGNAEIRLPEILEIIRVESDSEEKERKQRRKRAAYSRAGNKRKRSVKEEKEDEFDEEDWESRTVDGELGVVRGYVKSYPPGEAGEEELEEVELAFSRNRIVTVEVANGDFTFVKTCTQEFFGTGMIEVPPGGVKRTKNSGKMHLVFYIITGKVEVKIGENSFRVRKGAQFMVPRGNLYSIHNPFDVQAKMFFAQGCEVFAPEEDYEEGESE